LLHLSGGETVDECANASSGRWRRRGGRAGTEAGSGGGATGRRGRPTSAIPTATPPATGN